jgi:periplasmic divalent cation tolerance protein
MTDYVQVWTTTDTREGADTLARSTIEARLAACAQIDGPITSVYWWDGAAQTEQEWRIAFKTAADRYAALEAHILANHSYDTPEIVAAPITHGSAAYLAWLTAETRSGSEGT